MRNNDALAFLRRRTRLLVTVFSVTALAHVLVVTLRRPEFGADALLQLHPVSPSVAQGTSLEGLWVHEPISSAVLERLARRPQFLQRVRKLLTLTGSSDLAQKWRANRLSLAGFDEGNFVQASYRSPEEATIRPSLRAALRALVEEGEIYATRELQHAKRNLELRLASLETALEEHHVHRRRLAERLGVSGGWVGPDASDSLARIVGTLDLKLYEAEQAAKEIRREVELQRQSPMDDPDPQAIANDLLGTPVGDVIHELSTNLIRAELRRVAARERYTGKHPDRARAERDLESERQLFDSIFEESSPFAPYIRSAIDRRHGAINEARAKQEIELLVAENRLAGIHRLRNEKVRELQRSKEFESEVARLGDLTAGLERERDRIDQGLRELDLVTTCTSNAVSVFQDAGRVERMGKNLMYFAPAILALAGLIAVAVGYGVEVLDHRIHGPGDVAPERSGPLLGVIPRLDLADGELPPRWDPPAGAQAFHVTLERMLQRIPKGSMVAVVGRESGVGRSLLCANLAVCAGRLGLETLLLDLDLRSPRLAALFDLPDQAGLSRLAVGSRESVMNPENRVGGRGGSVRSWEVYRDPASIGTPAFGSEDATTVFALPTLYSKVSLVPGVPGIADPAGLIASEGMDEVFQVARNNFDLCLVDTSPLDGASEALLVASRCDSTVFVVDANRTTCPSLEEGCQGIREVGGHPLGWILNRHPGRVPVGTPPAEPQNLTAMQGNTRPASPEFDEALING